MPTKEKIGVVVSNQMNKTVVVAIQKQSAHGKYKKTITTTKKHKAHDEHNQYTIGDIVKIQETRPLSKTKRWKVINLVAESK
uniref:Small ribosomal subunit protein uS17c n=1 Tax=Hildenbrandia rivularis TaxID=135206 RepID=A0A1C9CFU0_9FLOR|nr:ribosomal protein S17 [Hildenbrandia rivularis]AOM67235.1 ribosomal protein S17 [Hildenbrandia rivularis]